MKHRRCRAKWAVVSIDTGIFRPSRGGDEGKEADVSMVQKIGAYAGSSPGRRRRGGEKPVRLCQSSAEQGGDAADNQKFGDC